MADDSVYIGTQGPQGDQGDQGVTGPTGPAGPGVPNGGTTGQILEKASGTDQDTQWTNRDKLSINLSYDTNVATTSSSYEILTYFGFDGTTALGIPVAIKILIETNANDGSIRVYDETNSQVIAELANFTDSVPTIKDMGTLSNLPTSPAVFSIQMKRNGSGSKYAKIHTMSIKF